MKHPTILLFFLYPFLCIQCQNRLVHLKSKLLSADSVIIVSHETTAGIILVDEISGKHLPLPRLIEKGKPNSRIIHETRTLNDTSIQRLSKIMSRPFQDTIIEIGKCFLPHHADILFKNGKISFIDMCFECKGIMTSKDIKITIDDFDNRKWTELIAFFKQKNIKYEFNLEEPSDDQ